MSAGYVPQHKLTSGTAAAGLCVKMDAGMVAACVPHLASCACPGHAREEGVRWRVGGRVPISNNSVRVIHILGRTAASLNWVQKRRSDKSCCPCASKWWLWLHVVRKSGWTQKSVLGSTHGWNGPCSCRHGWAGQPWTLLGGSHVGKSHEGRC